MQNKKKRKKELEELIVYHERKIERLEELASKEEDREYRADYLDRIERTRTLVSEWKEELANYD